VADYIYTPYKHVQSTASAEWTVIHRKKRSVTLSIFDDSGKPVFASWEPIDDSTLVVRFKKNGVDFAMSGHCEVF